jgi:hypothetical protein
MAIGIINFICDVYRLDCRWHLFIPTFTFGTIISLLQLSRFGPIHLSENIPHTRAHTPVLRDLLQCLQLTCNSGLKFSISYLKLAEPEASHIFCKLSFYRCIILQESTESSVLYDKGSLAFFLNVSRCSHPRFALWVIIYSFKKLYGDKNYSNKWDLLIEKKFTCKKFPGKVRRI